MIQRIHEIQSYVRKQRLKQFEPPSDQEISLMIDQKLRLRDDRRTQEIAIKMAQDILE